LAITENDKATGRYSLFKLSPQWFLAEGVMMRGMRRGGMVISLLLLLGLPEVRASEPPALSSFPRTVVSDDERDHWSFLPLRGQGVPEVKHGGWCRNPVDRFVMARLERAGISPSPMATRRVVARRAWFSVLGLPPSPAELDRFLNDSKPDAWERLVLRLLASPHYGQRWARHWMDVARFAESGGFEHDSDRNNAYHYRDFLIAAFNTDMPFDRFVKWQLAGDELAPEDPLAVMATGFLAAGVFPSQLTEAEFESARYDELDDIVTTTGVALLGLSVGCARCHDHKYDPIPSQDYYRLASAFTETIRGEITVQPPWQGAASKILVASEGLPKLKHNADGRGFPHFYKQTHFLARGDVSQKHGVADTGFLQVLVKKGTQENTWLQPPPKGWTRTSFRRAALARWITDPNRGAGHLLARVIVNRLWHYHLGTGLVATPNDLGVQGDEPTHPELLDYLARRLIEGGWRLKPIHHLLLTSSVYLQAGQVGREEQDLELCRQLDVGNQLWWHRPRRRLEAEAIRDALLRVSGLLDSRMYGPGTLDAHSPRRSVFLKVKRSRLVPSMMLFDWPEHLVSIGRRANTTTAAQALEFMNSPAGRGYAHRVADRLPDEAVQAIDAAWRIVLGRLPRSDESQAVTRFLGRQASIYQAAGLSSTRAQQVARVDMCQALLGMNEFIFLD